jgi:hypothetical protein
MLTFAMLGSRDVVTSWIQGTKDSQLITWLRVIQGLCALTHLCMIPMRTTPEPGIWGPQFEYSPPLLLPLSTAV